MPDCSSPNWPRPIYPSQAASVEELARRSSRIRALAINVCRLISPDNKSLWSTARVEPSGFNVSRGTNNGAAFTRVL